MVCEGSTGLFGSSTVLPSYDWNASTSLQQPVQIGLVLDTGRCY